MIGCGNDDPGEGAAHGSPRRGTGEFAVSMETSVPRQRDASESALVDMLMAEAPAGLALFGPDLRFRWVNAALTRFGGHPESDPASYAGRLPSEGWPPEVAARADAALRMVLAQGGPVIADGYPLLPPTPPPPRPPRAARAP